MAELLAKSPCDGLLPIRVGSLTLSAIDLGQLTSLAPFAGRQAALEEALQAAHGLRFPAPNTWIEGEGARIFWFGREIALLAGPAPNAAIAQDAALADQSDAWASVVLEGPGAEDTLARLVPVDLRPAHFGAGRTSRTLLSHMQASVSRLDEERILLMVFRSMVDTLVEELHEAMEAVMWRGQAT